ncbi:hypothetical protein OF83DRAFT_1113356 [Amylostereum chailletii]|nr:hypothetical protein OF83DRAFT_1113356 [Amylostereum chailletii]
MTDHSSPLRAFFANYPQFDYNPAGSPVNEFRRMRRDFPLLVPRGRNAAFRSALTNEFNWKYGTDVTKLESWQSLCRTVGIAPIPDTVTQCRKAVASVHINLVDLIDPSLVDEVRTFPSVHELAAYTRETKKFFPKNEAKAGGVLKALLRGIFRN